MPLTGWLAARFGAMREFALSVVGFGVFSALYGLARTLDLLVLLRVLQGLAGGTLMPLSQTVLMQISPKRQQPLAITMCAMTTLVAPVLVPVLGGLLVVWVRALQIVPDTGEDHDGFASAQIMVLGLIAVVGFAAFFIWALTRRDPVVSGHVFGHRGLSASMVNLAPAMGALFAVNVFTPLWLQEQVGYTATSAAYASAGFGISAMVAAPIVAGRAPRFDPRQLNYAGVLCLGFATLMRSAGMTQMTFAQVQWPVFLTGFGLPFFYIPLLTTALGSVDPGELEAAAGS